MTNFFNDEIEMYTHKHTSIKIFILAIALFAAFVFVGWLASTAVNLNSAMDVIADQGI